MSDVEHLHGPPFIEAAFFSPFFLPDVAARVLPPYLIGPRPINPTH